MQKKPGGQDVGVRSGGPVGGGGQGGCERRIEVIVKMQKSRWVGWRRWQVGGGGGAGWM